MARFVLCYNGWVGHCPQSWCLFSSSQEMRVASFSSRQNKELLSQGRWEKGHTNISLYLEIKLPFLGVLFLQASPGEDFYEEGGLLSLILHLVCFRAETPQTSCMDGAINAGRNSRISTRLWLGEYLSSPSILKLERRGHQAHSSPDKTKLAVLSNKFANQNIIKN